MKKENSKTILKKKYAIGISILAACAAVLLSVAQIRSDTIRSAADKQANEQQNRVKTEQTQTKPVYAADDLTVALDVLNEASSVLEEKQKEAQAVFEQAKEEIPETTAENVNAVPTKFTLPVGAALIKDFSLGVPVWSSTMGDWRTHNGVDFSAEQGEEVFAACAGTVSAVSEDRSWGGVVEVDCGNGLTARYCGLDFGLLTVAAGDQLQEGEVLGVIGSCPVEEKDGSHLHLEFRVNGEITDPLAVMGRDGVDDQ